MATQKTIGITIGDPAGIGPEIIQKALDSGKLPSDCEFLLIGDKGNVSAGKPSMESARIALNALEKSVELLKRGNIHAVATAPVGKVGLHQIGFDFPGQTEFFADRFQCSNHAMCLTGTQLTVALVTVHVPISQVPSLLRQEEIVRVGELLGNFCYQRGAKQPRVAVCGLNPHAGENGAFGSEDIDIIQPAVDALNARSNHVIFTGPHPPDTIFRPTANGEHDAVLCMYHDQGLIPLKLLDFETGVNTTLGLPYPRTSPDHGTAYNIAGQGIADPSSMIHAIRLACQLASCG